MRFHYSILLNLFILLPVSAAAETAASILKNGGALIADSAGRPLLEHRSKDHFVPASIIKVATVAAAIDILGEDYRFPTEFYSGRAGELYVKGFGDPKLISEELKRAAKALRSRLPRVSRIVLDDSYFAPGIAIDGASQSTNPYDATNGALLANFNTVYLTRGSGGSVRSAEPQTPLTPVARSMASRVAAPVERINLGPRRDRALRYVAELLAVFLRDEGVTVADLFEYGAVPADAKLIYRHLASESLSEVSRGLLKYSTNFSANQIFLSLGAERFGAPATQDKGARALSMFLTEKVGWKDFQIVEGAGLSRRNKVTPEQMVRLMRWFEPYKGLLSTEKGFSAKTGSLRGVSTLAGFTSLPGRGEVIFAVMVNDNVPAMYKFKATERLLQLARRRAE